MIGHCLPIKNSENVIRQLCNFQINFRAALIEPHLHSQGKIMDPEIFYCECDLWVQVVYQLLKCLVTSRIINESTWFNKIEVFSVYFCWGWLFWHDKIMYEIQTSELHCIIVIFTPDFVLKTLNKLSFGDLSVIFEILR